jgi:hypothetical protein
MPNSAEQKEAAIWQPLPSMLNAGHKAFVRVRDERGQTSNFARWSYKRLDGDAVAAVGASATKRPAYEPLPSADAHPSQQEPGSASGDRKDTAQAATSSEAANRQAYERGIEEGRRLQAAEQEVQIEALVEQRHSADQQHTLQLLGNIESGIAALKAQPERLHEPLKRLALHIAEELTLAELSLSTRSIEQLIQRCLDVLDAPASSHVLIELNPQDLMLLQTQAEERIGGHWRLQAQPEFLPGSVRVSAADASVTDLVEHRLATLAQALLQDPQLWQSHSSFGPQRHRSRLDRAPVQDVTARNAEAMPGAPVDTEAVGQPIPPAHEPRDDEPNDGR